MRKLVACSADVKICSKQIVHEAFRDILCGNFIIPSQKELEHILKDHIDYDFDEYQKKRKIIAKHPPWDDEQVNDEVYRLKLRYDKEYRRNLMQAVSEAAAEIESLISSLNDAIKAWKIKNLT
ncbi:hypothetical protein ACFL0M_14940 [Thermodesulfobacteriota bacterium]